MDTIFMNSENSKTSKLHALILKLINKSYLRISGKIILPDQIFAFITRGKI